MTTAPPGRTGSHRGSEPHRRPLFLVVTIIALLLATAAWLAVQALSDAPPPPGSSRAQVTADIILVDSRGQVLSDAAGAGVRSVHDALVVGNVDALHSLVAPGAPTPDWAALARKLAVPGVRTAMAEVLQTTPTTAPDGNVVYSHGNYGITLDPTGQLVRLGAASSR